jgi:radical SAM protein with 4Fe4S-binding SPASM domain
MCPHGEQKVAFPIGDMPFSMATDILLQSRNKAHSVKLNWRGEPFLYPHLPEIISTAKLYNYTDIMLNTNGNVSFEKILEACKAGLTYLAFSIDGTTLEEYQSIRRNGDFLWVMNNLQQTCARKKDFPKLRVILQARVKNPTQGIFERFQALLPPGCELKIAPMTWRTGFIDKPEGLKRKDCIMPKRRLLIDWKGNVYSCCADWFGKSPLGNIKKNTLEELWLGADVWREELRSGEAFNKEPCKSCFSRESYVLG